MLARNEGWEVMIAHGARYQNPSEFDHYQVSTPLEERVHWLISQLCDGQGRGSWLATRRFLKKIESMLDEMKFPQSFRANRVFCQLPEPKVAAPPMGSPPSGAYGTFHLKVLFRQNASWQGSVTWVEGHREESFRSVLELLLLMDSAICAKNKEGETSKVTK